MPCFVFLELQVVLYASLLLCFALLCFAGLSPWVPAPRSYPIPDLQCLCPSITPGLRARSRGRRPSVGGMHGRCVRKDRLLLAAPGFLVFFLSLSLALSPFFPAFRSLSMSLCLPHPLPLGPSLFLLVLSLSICHDDDSDGDDDEDDDGDEDLRLTLRKGKVAVT